MKVEKKSLGLMNLFSLGVGAAVGSGIFVMMGFGIAYTGRSIVLAVSVGCLYMLFAYLFHLFMSSMFIFPGGDYDMKSLLLGPTMTGFAAMDRVVGSLGLASYGLAFASYFVSVFLGLENFRTLIAALIMILFFALSIRGTKVMANATTVITAVLLISIALFIIMGVPKVQPGFWSNEDGLFFKDGFNGFIGAIAIMSFACQGTTMGSVAVMSMTKNARRIVPLSIILVCLTVGLVYALMAYVAAGVLPVEEVMGQNLSLVASSIFNPALFNFFILGAACCAIMSSLSSGLTQSRYPLLAVAEDGWLPKVFKKTTKSGYPYMVMGMLLVFSILPIFTRLSVDTLISLVMIPAMILNAYMNFAMIRMIKKYPTQWKNATLHMSAPIFNLLCIIATICALAVAFYLFKDMDTASRILCAVILVIMLTVSQICLRTGIVKKEDLLNKRERIAAAAIAATEAENSAVEA